MNTVMAGTILHTVIGIIAGILIGFIIGRLSRPNVPTLRKVLSGVFGVPQIRTTYYGKELAAWLDDPKRKFRQDSKVLVMKVNNRNLKNLLEAYRLSNPQGDFDPHNFLVIASVNGTDIKETVLIEYEKLDSAMEEQLGTDGVLVVQNLLQK